jgi:hypothetical protein
MSLLTDRFDAGIDRLGESITWTKLNGSAGSFAHNCIVRPAESGLLNTFFDIIELSAFGRPVVIVIVKAAVTAKAADTFTRDSVAWRCERVFTLRLSNEAIGKYVLMSQV